MLHCLKIEKQKIAYDTASGAIIPLTALEYKMLGAVCPPLSPLCPSSLRYELAKYDSYDVEKAYDRLYALYRDGKIFAAECGQCCVQIGGPYGLKEVGAVAHEIVRLVNDTPIQIRVNEDADRSMANALTSLFEKR